MHIFLFEYTGFDPPSFSLEELQVTLAGAFVLQTVIESRFEVFIVVKDERIIIGGGPATRANIWVLAIAVATLSTVAAEGFMHLSTLGAHGGRMEAFVFGTLKI